MKKGVVLVVAGMLLSIFASLAHSVGVPVSDPNKVCAFMTMRDDFKDLAKIKGLKGLSQDLIASLQRHREAFMNANVANLECDPDRDFIESLSNSVEQVRQHQEESIVQSNEPK